MPNDKLKKQVSVLKDNISMPRAGVIREHKRLIPELRKAGLTKEASKQSKELKEYQN